VVSKTTGTTTDSSPIYSTDTLYVDWAVINNGTASITTSFKTSLYVDGSLVNSWDAASLSASAYTSIQDYSIGMLSAGTHTIKIVADSAGVVGESNEADNEYTRSITVTSSGCTPTPITAGQTVSGSLSTSDCRSAARGSSYYADRYSFSASAGQQVAIALTSSAFDAYLYVMNASGTVISSNDDGGGGTNSRIPAGSGYTTLPSAGTYIIEVTSYGANKIGNYTVTFTAPSASAKPNLTPYQPSGWSDKIVVSKTRGTSTDGSNFRTTDTLYVDWAVINNGSAANSKSFKTSLYVDGTLKTSWSKSSLAINSYVSVLDYSVGRLKAGTHTVRIVTDSAGAIAESNEGDNEYTKTITVSQ
jgi:hypothetical protein